MSDYSFMKSGFNMVENTNNDFIKDATALTFNFMENAIQSALFILNTPKDKILPLKILKEHLCLNFFYLVKEQIIWIKLKKLKKIY